LSDTFSDVDKSALDIGYRNGTVSEVRGHRQGRRVRICVFICRNRRRATMKI
jgi:hypothetical protein